MAFKRRSRTTFLTTIWFYQKSVTHSVTYRSSDTMFFPITFLTHILLAGFIFGNGIRFSFLIGSSRLNPMRKKRSLLIVIAVIFDVVFTVFYNICTRACFALVQMSIRHLRMLVKFSEGFYLTAFKALFLKMVYLRRSHPVGLVQTVRRYRHLNNHRRSNRHCRHYHRRNHHHCHRRRLAHREVSVVPNR